MADERKGFWSSLPGVLTGLAAVLTAVSGLYVAIRDDAGPDDTAASGTVPAAEAPPARGVPAPATDRFTLEAVIDDPDGYTFVRSMKSAQSQIVARVEQGERFHTHTQDGSWWQVRTRDGKVGYMHVSRIRVLPPG